MSNSVEVVSFDSTERLEELTRATWENAEPGFQVEGVENIEQLYAVFEAIKRVRPEGQPNRRLNNAFSTWKGFFNTNVLAHIDREYSGLAVHQNISETVPVHLAIATGHDYKGSDPFKIDTSQTEEVKSGETQPGVLTIFSEGDNTSGLRPTVHFFDRRKGYSNPNEWVRYGHFKRPQFLLNSISPMKIGSPHIRHRANLAFKRLDKRHPMHGEKEPVQERTAA